MSKQQQEGGKPNKQSNAGRKSKYYTHIQPNLKIIGQYRRNGLTLEQIGERFNVSHESINQYKNKHPEFAEVLKLNAENALAAVENALYESAMSGNLGAIIFVLKNRSGGKWRDRQHIFQQTTATVTRKDYENMTDEELEREEELLNTIAPEQPEFEDGNGEVH